MKGRPTGGSAGCSPRSRTAPDPSRHSAAWCVNHLRGLPIYRVGALIVLRARALHGLGTEATEDEEFDLLSQFGLCEL